MLPDTALPRARRAYSKQRSRAREREITFTFDFDEWLEWWLVDGRWERRGRGGDKLCMCRLGDRGPYADWNVYAATFREKPLLGPSPPDVVVRWRHPIGEGLASQ